MAALVKDVFNPKMIRMMGRHLKRADGRFDEKAFIAEASKGLKGLELKERSNQIVLGLEAGLPKGFEEGCEVMLKALSPERAQADLSWKMDTGGIEGWAIMPMGDYVARHGLEHFDLSMGVLKEFTKRFSAEFAVRPFLAANPERGLRHVYEWAKDGSVHVRRLASEGTRPRLPWGMRLVQFDAEPRPVLPVLERLKDDPEVYVRRSVANHLNDIGKRHPELVAATAARWMVGGNGERQRLVRHGCRSLVKEGHRATLKALGYGKARVVVERFEVSPREVEMGEALAIMLELKSDKGGSQPLIIDYRIHHRKANGGTTPKVFKWKTVRLMKGERLSLIKKHCIKEITTRVYYGGTHQVEVLINGESYGRLEFELIRI